MDLTMITKDLLSMAVEAGLLALIGMAFSWLKKSKEESLKSLATKNNEEAVKMLARKAIDATEEWAYSKWKESQEKEKPTSHQKLDRATNMVVELSMGAAGMATLTEEAAKNEVLAELAKKRG